ncbi:hypothetical protein Tco_0174138 [Tanacetum coccineum]
MGTVSDVITGGTEGAVQQGPDGKVVGSRCPWEDTMRYNQGRPFREKQWQDGNCVAWNARRQNRARECQGQSDFKIQYYFKDKMLLMQAQESGAVLDEEQCCFLQENRHVHDNISHRKDLIYDEAGTSYDSNTPSEARKELPVYLNSLKEWSLFSTSAIVQLRIKSSLLLALSIQLL